MSILIKGVRLPSNCFYCPMQFGGFCYVMPYWVEGGRVASTVDEAYKQGIPSWCPLEEVPSAQPEIIHCKECKFAHMTYDGECKYCDVWFHDESEYLDGDYYCASAERRTDE